MNEFSLINKIKPSYYRQAGLVKGIGDDAAVFKETQNNLVTATDMFVENIHFSRQTMNPKQIGYRLLAVNLSDLAAMGARPIFYLVSIVVPHSWKKDVEDIFWGMDELAQKYNMDLIGGDTVSGKQLVISINIIGRVKDGKARYRSHAKARDLIFVTGTLGDSRAGLHILQSKKLYKASPYFVYRHQYPSPRIAFALQLQAINRLALNDISDGLISEASEIALASKVNIIIEEDLIPVSKSFSQFSKNQQKEWKLFGGEDFELLGVTSASNWPSILEAGKNTNTRVKKIGYVTAPKNNQKGQVYLMSKEGKRLIKRRGYIHL